MQIPKLVMAALDRGKAGMVGKGIPRKPNVHLEDGT